MVQRKIELGRIKFGSHRSKTLTDALGIPASEFDRLVGFAREAWNYGDTISKSVEYLAMRLKNSRFVLAVLILGRIWEEQQKGTGEKDIQQISPYLAPPDVVHTKEIIREREVVFIRCPSCNTKNEEGSKFCAHCGAPL